MHCQLASRVRSGAFAEQGLELCEDLLDRIEVGAVGGQEEQLCAGGSDDAANGLSLVTTEIVHDDDVAELEARTEKLLDVGEEAGAIDRPVEDERGIDAVMAQGCEEGERSPPTVRHFGETPATRSSAVGTAHIGFGPGLVYEDEVRRIELVLMRLPAHPSPGDVRPILFVGVQPFMEWPAPLQTCGLEAPARLRYGPGRSLFPSSRVRKANAIRRAKPNRA